MNNIKIKKRYAIPLAVITGIFLWAKGLLFFPILNGNTLKHPLGYSITVNKNTYACVTDTGFMIKPKGSTSMSEFPPPPSLLKSKTPPPKETECVGPPPSTKVKTTYFQPRFPNNNRTFFIQIDAQSFTFPAKDACTAVFKQRSKHRGLRTAEITLCSHGGGSGGLEYTANGVVRYDGKLFTAGGFMQMEGWVSFNYIWDVLLTIKRAPSGH